MIHLFNTTTIFLSIKFIRTIYLLFDYAIKFSSRSDNLCNPAETHFRSQNFWSYITDAFHYSLQTWLHTNYKTTAPFGFSGPTQ